MKIFLQTFSFLFAVLISCNNKTISSKPVNANTLLWKIESKHSQPTYLYGTFHMLCKDDILINVATRNSIAAADKVYLELDMDDPKLLMESMAFMIMKNDTTLQQLLSADEYNKVSKFFSDSLQLPFTVMNHFKPALLGTMIYPYYMNCDNYSGVEEVITQIAKKSNKKILGLETISDQMSVFDRIPYQVQSNALLLAVDSVQAYKTDFNLLIKAYKNQELSKLENAVSESSDPLNLYMDDLLYKRNFNWLNLLKEKMKEEKLFVAVGAGHLPGSKGLLELLRKNGYTVTPVYNN